VARSAHLRQAHAVSVAFGRLPLSFEPNVGQADPRVRFLAHGRSYTLFLTDAGAVLALQAPATRPALPAALSRRPALPAVTRRPTVTTYGPALAARPWATGATVRISLLDADPHPRLEAVGRLPGVVNYFLGNDPRRWRAGIPTYAQVVYHNVYPGIDQVFFSRGGQPGYAFVLRPGADPAAIRLVVSTPLGPLVQHPALLYQQGAQRGQPTAAQSLEGWIDRVSIWPGASEWGAGPIVSPLLSYVTSLAGSSDKVGAIAVDGADDAYVTGRADSSDFPVTPGAAKSTFTGGGDLGSDAYVAKLNATGTALLYATYLGGSGADQGTGIAVDGAGDAYITGYTDSGDFPVTPGALQRQPPGSEGGAFVAKLNSAGTALLYATYLGDSDAGNGIALDRAGDAYVAGVIDSSGFPTTPRAPQASYHGGTSNAFVAKLNAAGTALLYATYLGGSDEDSASGIAVDGAGNAYVTGQADSSDFPVTPGALQPGYRGGARNSFNAFVAKLNAAGTALLYATYLGGSNIDAASGIAVDGAGDAYVTGYTASSDFPTTPGAQQSTSPSQASFAFVAKLNRQGSALLYSATVGGSLGAEGAAIAVDGAGNAYVTGSTQSSDFPITRGAVRSTHEGEDDTFVAKLNARGSALLYSTYGGGLGIAVDRAGDAYVIGQGRVARVVIPAAPLAALDPVSPPGHHLARTRYFPQTRHTLSDPFLAFWDHHGNIAILGLPLSEPFVEGGQTVQYFERARLVLAGGQMQVSPLGRWITAGRTFEPAPPPASSAGRLYFPTTDHLLTGRFLAFWQAHQGSVVLGQPISEPLTEQVGDGTGKQYLVQYFVDARLEYHPESAGTPYEVSVGQLGREYLHRRGLL
jgi:hypothetical protein